MKREEAINTLRKFPIGLMDLGSKEKQDITEAIDMALAALRGPTREQVEKWKGEWTGNFNAHCSLCDTFSTMAYIGQGGNFCSNCGAPMTDEAVDIVMERLEALKDEID